MIDKDGNLSVNEDSASATTGPVEFSDTATTQTEYVYEGSSIEYYIARFHQPIIAALILIIVLLIVTR